MSSSLDIPDLDRRAQQIFAKVDEAGWEAWSEPGEDSDHCTVRIAPSRTDDVVVTTVWSRDPVTGRTNLVDAEGDGRELPGINAVVSYLVEEMRLD
jgi:hypothetical protein